MFTKNFESKKEQVIFIPSFGQKGTQIVLPT